MLKNILTVMLAVLLAFLPMVAFAQDNIDAQPAIDSVFYSGGTQTYYQGKTIYGTLPDSSIYVIDYEYHVPRVTLLNVAQDSVGLDSDGGLDMGEFANMELDSDDGKERKKSKGDTIHKWLGISTLLFTAAIPLSAPKTKISADDPDYEKAQRETAGFDAGEYGLHEDISEIATVLALATVTSGLISYWGNGFDLSKGVFYRKNIHAYLGIVGTLLMAYSVSGAPDPEHVQPGVLGGVMMGVAYGLTFTF